MAGGPQHLPALGPAAAVVLGDRVVDRVLAVARQTGTAPVRGLTDREREVLELLPSMRSVDEIADDLAAPGWWSW